MNSYFWNLELDGQNSVFLATIGTDSIPASCVVICRMRQREVGRVDVLALGLNPAAKGGVVASVPFQSDLKGKRLVVGELHVPGTETKLRRRFFNI